MWEKAEKFLSKDSRLGLLVEKFSPCTIAPSSSSNYFSDLVNAIVSQQLSGKVAEVIFTRLKDSISIKPENILSEPVENMRSLGLSYSKIKYIKDLADKTEKRIVDLKTMEKQDDEEVVSRLMRVKGIGRWTAEMFLMFSLARPDVFPVDDLGIKKGMKKIFAKELDQEQMRQSSLRWKPYRSVAAWYVWRSLEV